MMKGGGLRWEGQRPSERRKPGSFVRVDTGEGPESPVLLNVAAHLLGTGHPSQCDGNTGS